MSNNPFQRLQSELSAKILSLPAETRLPSEPCLARQMGVSRATLREAMRSFEGRGMIRRRQGVGTFVIGKVPVLDTGLEMLESIETIAQRSGLKVRMGELLIQQVSADDEMATKLNLSVGANLTRVRRIDLHRPAPDSISGRHPADGYPGRSGTSNWFHRVGAGSPASARRAEVDPLSNRDQGSWSHLGGGARLADPARGCSAASISPTLF